MIADVTAQERATMEVLYEVLQERQRQDGKWGEQNHGPMDWIAIEAEEFGEAAMAANKGEFTYRNLLGIDTSVSLLRRLWRHAIRPCGLPFRKAAFWPASAEAARHLDAFEEEMIQVAAVAVAAVESIRRQRTQGDL